MENRTDAYVEADHQQKRHVKHIALRAVEPAGLAKFYRDVFELTEMEKPADDRNFYLSDGTVVFVIMPWDITDFAGTGIERPALDHIGFKVESVDALKSELQKVKRERAALAPNPIGAEAGPEGEARLNLFAKCPLGQFHMSDPDGVLIDVSDR
jgi:catechol-2,3-dioxygenase